MATYTTNYNLSKPENTDSQEDFIDAYCDNMDIIDQNMGGGGGNADVVHLTKAEYDALPDTKLSDNKIYLIEDAPSGGGGSSVTWTQIQATGEKIAEITINGTTTDVLIPFEAKIIVTTTTGLTVTATKGGTTYTATETSTGVYEVTVDSNGTWTVTDGTNTTTVSVTAQTTYNVAFVVIPDGSTVTPTDDIQTWLNCANIWDKNYTTLAEVLADSTTLSALISDNNATDYLVRSTTWASGMCADSTAMTYIGLNNYCANKLLADATWCNAIWNSTYKTSVINVSVPIMADYTTPSGEVIESGHRTDLPDTAGWYAFGNQPSSRGWFSQNSGSTDTYLGYVFDDDVRLVAVVISPHTSPNTNSILRDTGYIQGSNDSFVTSDTLDTIATGSYTDLTVVTPNNKKFRAIRIFASRGSGTNNTVIRQLQFYGRKDV